MPNRDGVGASGAERERPPEAVEHAVVPSVSPASFVQALREPVVVILLLAAFFDGISGNPLHAVVLGSVAVALTLDAVTRRLAGAPPTEVASAGPRGRVAAWMVPEGSGTWLGVVFAAGVLGYAVVAGGFARYSWPATIAVVVPAAGGVMVAWGGPLPGAPEPVRPSRVGSFLWAGVFVALSLIELAMLLLQPTLTTESWAHPTLSTLMDPTLASHPGRAVSLCVWAGVGWLLVRR